MIVLTKLSETSNTITLGWEVVTGAVGYRFQSSTTAPKWSHTFDPARTSIKFSKADWYKVEALGVRDAGQYPTAPLPTGDKLTWTPPGYVGGDPRDPASFPGFTVIDLASGGSTYTLNPSERYFLRLGDYDHGARSVLTINGGGRETVMVGGRMRNTSGPKYYAGMILNDPLGHLYMEGIDFFDTNPSYVYDSIALRTTSGYSSPTDAIITFQNCRIKSTVAPGGTFNVEHPDAFQWQGNGTTHAYQGEIRMDKVTMDISNTGFNAGTKCSKPTVPRVTWKRVNGRHHIGADGSSLVAYLMQWYRESFALTLLDDFYGETGTQGHHVIDYCLHPSSVTGRISPAVPVGGDKCLVKSDAIGSYAEYPAGANVIGKFRPGIPPGGDRCAKGVPGTSYVYSGYV